MKRIRDLLTDRRRAQRGSVLSGVLIMLAFIAIISGALTTALSTNFLISSAQANRTANQATVNSAAEMAVSQLQTTPLNAPCPPSPQTLPTLNGRTAVFSFVNCAPTVRAGEPQFKALWSYQAQFKVDGTHVQLSGLNDYLIGDSYGNVFDYPFGANGALGPGSPRWVVPGVGGKVAAPPLVIPNPNQAGTFVDLIPMSAPGCPQPAPYCLTVIDDNTAAYSPPSQPPVRCSIPLATGPILSPPASSMRFGGLVYYGDGTRLKGASFSGGGCATPQFSTPITASVPVVAGPAVFGCSGGCNGNGNEYVYAVASDSSSSQVVGVAYDGRRLSYIGPLNLPWGGAVGLAISGSSLPASLVVTFGNGGIALVQIASNGSMTLAGPRPVLPGAIASAPFWCVPCGNLVGVGTLSGGFYVFDQSLNQYASYANVGSSISRTPGTDGAGNWYVGANDSYVHMLQVQTAPAMAEVNRLGQGQIGWSGTAVIVDSCGATICIYFGALDAYAYLIRLDARGAIITACIGSSPTTCSGASPRLATKVEIGAWRNPRTVHVQSWTYNPG